MKDQEIFIKAVMREVNMLKLHATTEEIGRLDFETLFPTGTATCIYGQMTLDCRNLRSEFLMNNCCNIIVNMGDTTHSISEALLSDEFQLNVYSGQTWRKSISRPRDFTYVSALEAYICLPNANNYGIIQYLKGEIETLTL